MWWWWWRNRAPYDYIYLLNRKGFFVYPSLRDDIMRWTDWCLSSFFPLPLSSEHQQKTLSIVTNKTISNVEQINTNHDSIDQKKWMRNPWSWKTDRVYKRLVVHFINQSDNTTHSIFTLLSHAFFFDVSIKMTCMSISLHWYIMSYIIINVWVMVF